MEKKIALSVTLLAIALVIAAILAPGARKLEGPLQLPWLITITPDGATEVFGLTLNHSKLHEARIIFAKDATLNLFKTKQGEYSLEAYFEKIFLSGLRGDFVLRIAMDDASAQGLFERGARISQLGSGTSKVELSEKDRAWVYQQPIELITYLPMANLDEELIASRFGQPSEKIAERDGVVHWLYPEKGLDLGYNPDGREVLQYIHPQLFHRLLTPLKEQPKYQPGQSSL